MFDTIVSGIDKEECADMSRRLVIRGGVAHSLSCIPSVSSHVLQQCTTGVSAKYCLITS